MKRNANKGADTMEYTIFVQAPSDDIITLTVANRDGKWAVTESWRPRSGKRTENLTLADAAKAIESALNNYHHSM
jgi:hypothetical protein